MILVVIDVAKDKHDCFDAKTIALMLATEPAFVLPQSLKLKSLIFNVFLRPTKFWLLPDCRLQLINRASSFLKMVRLVQ